MIFFRIVTVLLLLETLLIVKPHVVDADDIRVLIDGFLGVFGYGCSAKECCNKKWVPNDLDALKGNITSSLYGQHIASDAVFSTIKGHVQNRNPQKALALVFLGRTGIGKSYLSKLVAESLYFKGQLSRYVHTFIATADFVKHENRLEEYEDYLMKYIESAVKECERSLFIFDEIHELPTRLLAILKPYLDHHSNVHGIDFRKSIFIFMGNNGASSISSIAYDHWAAGNVREDLKLREFDKILKLAMYNEDGGLYDSPLIISELIDIYVPFLPMERKHVIMCINADIRGRYKTVKQGLNFNEILDEFDFYPNDSQLFSESGCKRVSQKVDLFISYGV